MKKTSQMMLEQQAIDLSDRFQFQIKHIPIKRAFDIFFSLIVMILGAPVFLLIAILIRITSGKGVLFRHERIGRGGVPFYCYKFRTMYPDAARRLQEILQNDQEKMNEWSQFYKLKNDPRITPIGIFLRKTSLDELPQFWNVLKGDLSVVGPRPVVQEEVIKNLGVKAYKILSIRPGITGMWQVSGRNDTSYEKRIELEETYINNQSFLLDMKLIAKTIPSMISSKGAY